MHYTYAWSQLYIVHLPELYMSMPPYMQGFVHSIVVHTTLCSMYHLYTSPKNTVTLH